MRRKNVVVVTGTCLVLAVVLFVVGLPPVISAAAGSSGYKILKTIHVPGTEGWDYVTMDSDARRLYIGLRRCVLRFGAQANLRHRRRRIYQRNPTE
jgi:hypothetical protein